MKKIFFITIFVLLSVSCSTYKTQLAQLDSNINKFGKIRNTEDDFSDILKLHDTNYSVQIVLSEHKTMMDPYSNLLFIRLNNKQSIAYWIREYCSEKDSLGQRLTYETYKAYLSKMRRDIITIRTNKKDMKKLLDYILRNEVYKLKGIEDLRDKCPVYVDDPMLLFGMSISNNKKYCNVAYYAPSEYADSCPELADLKTFLEAIEVIRASIGANKTFSSTIE